MSEKHRKILFLLIFFSNNCYACSPKSNYLRWKKWWNPGSSFPQSFWHWQNNFFSRKKFNPRTTTVCGIEKYSSKNVLSVKSFFLAPFWHCLWCVRLPKCWLAQKKHKKLRNQMVWKFVLATDYRVWQKVIDLDMSFPEMGFTFSTSAILSLFFDFFPSGHYYFS